MNTKRLLARLSKCKTEEEVKASWASALKVEYNTSDSHDLYTTQILFEFKLDKNLKAATARATVLAQLLYYIRRMKFGHTAKMIPNYICGADKNELIIGQVKAFRDLYIEDEGQYDWDLAPSSPDSNLIEAIEKHPSFESIEYHSLGNFDSAETAFSRVRAILESQSAFEFGERTEVNENNFESVFEQWNDLFGENVKNEYKPSHYFVCDIEAGATRVRADQGKVDFRVNPDDFRTKKILSADYNKFWSRFEKVTNPLVLRGVLAKSDRLTEDTARRAKGEFFTPIRFADKALEYLEREVGSRWWRTGRYRLWDMAAGTGNLQYNLPAAAWPYLYLSTIHKHDVDYCHRIFPGANVFQYDYLNDDISNVFGSNEPGDAAANKKQTKLDLEMTSEWNMPTRLREDLANPDLRWIILINPPFATAQQGGATGANKADVSRTKVRELMHAEGMGEVSRELFAQFLFRIRHEFKGRQAHLGLFSKLKYINATNDQTFRDKVFAFEFCRGFMFSSVNFDGTSRKSQFPVGFLIWNLSRPKPLDVQKISLEVFDENVQKTAKKVIAAKHRNLFLSRWIERSPNTSSFPPFSSAITIKTAGPDIRDRIAKGFLASLMCKGNDLQNQNMTALLSGPYASAGGMSVTAKNFEKCMVVHAVRRLPRVEWHNDRDQFMAPDVTLPATFVHDCVVWSLLSPSNNTVAIRAVKYAGETFRIKNHFFPFRLDELRNWTIADADIANSLSKARDRYVARWLAEHKLSTSASNVMDAAEEVYRLYFSSMNQLRTSKFKISTWDAGWWQVRGALRDAKIGKDQLSKLSESFGLLTDKLRPQLYKFGFLA